VGVARNVRTQRLRGDVEPRYFVAIEQDLSAAKYPVFLIRTVAEPALVLEGIRQAFRRVDASLPIDSAHSFEEQIAPLTAQDRTTTQLAVVFGIIAITLAAIGLYGVLSYGVARRTGEIAVRIALGAQPGCVVRMILSETTELVVTGLAVGAALAYAASSLISSRLFGVAPQDPLTLASATILLLAVAFTAAFLPARKASKLDPMTALRRE
jgi:predicted lysophospholipase L1 biosynthesis ABC-type transport system permease subunit